MTQADSRKRADMEIADCIARHGFPLLWIFPSLWMKLAVNPCRCKLRCCRCCCRKRQEASGAAFPMLGMGSKVFELPPVADMANIANWVSTKSETFTEEE